MVVQETQDLFDDMIFYRSNGDFAEEMLADIQTQNDGATATTTTNDGLIPNCENLINNSIHPNDAMYDPKTFVLNRSATKILIIGVKPLFKVVKPFFEETIQIYDAKNPKFSLTFNRLHLRRLFDILRYDFGFRTQSTYLDVKKYTMEELESSHIKVEKIDNCYNECFYKISLNLNKIYLGTSTINKLFEIEEFVFKIHDNIKLDEYDRMILGIINDVSQIAEPYGFDTTRMMYAIKKNMDLYPDNDNETYFKIQTLSKFYPFFQKMAEYILTKK